MAARKGRKSPRRTSAGSRSSAQSGVYDDVVALAGSLVRSRKEFSADKLTNFAEATRQFAESMPEMAHVNVYVMSAADRLDELADYVATREFEDILEDTGELARRYPLATLGVAIAAGYGLVSMTSGRSFGGSSSSGQGQRRSRTSSRASSRSSSGKRRVSRARERATANA